MTQNVMVEIGQCGNQIGRRFWEMALAEHSGVKSDLNFDSTLASFFRNTDSRSGKGFGVLKLKISRIFLKCAYILFGCHEKTPSTLVH